MNALLLSAGLGTRFRPTTDKLAKPVIPFLNVPLMGYMLYYLESLGLENLVFNTHHLPKTVELAAECLTHGQKYKVNFSHEPKILGSGGGILQAKKFLLDGGASANHSGDNFSSSGSHLSSSGEKFFLVGNADEVLLFNHDKGFAPLIDFHKKTGALATLLTTGHPDAGRKLGGVWVNSSDNQITRLGGQHSDPGAQHFTGIFVFSEKVFSYMPTAGEFHIFTDCLHKAMAKNEKVLAFHDPDVRWFEMSSEKEYLASTFEVLEMLEQAANNLPGRSVTGAPISPENVQMQTKNILKIWARFNQTVERVAPKRWQASQTEFKGTLPDDAYLFMGDKSQIGRDVEIKNFAVMGSNTRFSQGFLERAVIAAHLQIDPLTSLRNQLLI